MKVIIDDEEVFEGRGLVFVGNISRYSIGLQILKRADFGDGLLDVCIYKCSSQLHLLKHSAMTVMKVHSKKSDVIYKQGKSIQVSSPHKDVRTQIDGDPGPKMPIQIEVIPQAVQVMVPPNAKPAGIRTRLIRMLG
jgi:diacylglycerol kinase family enzyme